MTYASPKHYVTQEVFSKDGEPESSQMSNAAAVFIRKLGVVVIPVAIAADVDLRVMSHFSHGGDGRYQHQVDQ
jgi:hypothetical protein